MLSDKEEKFCLLLKNGQHVLDLKKFETSVPRPVHWAGQMSSASPYSVIQHLLFEISVVTFIWVKYVNRTRLGFWWLTTDPKYVSAPDCSFGSGSLSLGNATLCGWGIFSSESHSKLPILIIVSEHPSKRNSIFPILQQGIVRCRNLTCPRATQEICVKDGYEKDGLNPYLLPQAQNYYYYLYITINVYGILQTDKVTGTAELTLSIIKPSFCPWWWIWGEEAFYFCSNIFSTFWNLNLNFSCGYFFLSASLNT